MRSFRRGRPSSFGTVTGGIVGLLFGTFWLGMASKIHAPWPFIAFGIFFVGFALCNIVYGVYKFRVRRRFGASNVTRDRQGRDPLEQELERLRRRPTSDPEPTSESTPKARFCPTCGAGLKQEFQFCPGCGKQV